MSLQSTLPKVSTISDFHLQRLFLPAFLTFFNADGIFIYVWLLSLNIIGDSYTILHRTVACSFTLLYRISLYGQTTIYYSAADLGCS